MNSFPINDNSFDPENYFMQSYIPPKNANLMKYLEINKKFTRETNIDNLENNNIKNTKDNKSEDEEIIPERSLSNYVNNKYLSDAILKLNENEFYIHKIVLCSCSDYINNQFISNPISKEKQNENGNNEENKENEIKNENKDKVIINFPEIISSSFGGGNRVNCIEKILKYCYNNQSFKSIESDINQFNVFSLLELSHSLGIKSLKLNLEKKIIKNYLGRDNATKLALESKIFDLPKLNKACINYIATNFKFVKIFKSDIIDLDFETFKKIMSSEEINIDNEKDISDFVINYIRSRRELPEENEAIKENKEIKENINNEEQKEEEKKEEEKKEEEKKEEEKKEEEKKEEKKEEKNENNINEKWKNDLNKLKETIKKKKLSKEQEKELIMCIRFNNISHNELVRLTNEPILDEYKDILLQALSSKLDIYEQQQKNDNREFSNNPRYYSQNENQERDNNNNENNNFYYSQNNFGNKNNIEFLNNKSMPNTNYSSCPKSQRFYDNNKIKTLNNEDYYNDNNNYFKKSDFYNNNPRDFNYNRFYKNNNITNKDNVHDYYNKFNINNNNEEFYNIKQNNKENNNDFEENFNEDRQDVLNSQFFNINNKSEKEKINRYRQMIKSDIKKNPNKIEQSSLSSSNNQLINPLNYNIKFKYKYDFDKNGALYYIGTYGLSRNYQNPHDLKLIKAFGSSLLSGYYSDFIGRNVVNLYTENEENSFFGVDLGPNRYLLPTLYSIRNRDSSLNVLLNWDLQGSNDKINFTILDKRRFNSEFDNRDKYKKYRNLLKEPKTTSTWGISKKIREKYPNGFRYFLLKQIGKNSSGSYHLAISGFELYGDGFGDGWIFS